MALIISLDTEKKHNMSRYVNTITHWVQNV